MNKRATTKCVICGEPVEQDRSTSVPRETCKRIREGNVWVKSPCEREKNRRYQEKYRKSEKKSFKKMNESVALSNNAHLKKYKAKTYKRFCLKCDKKFTGKGPYNRICNHCTIENSRARSIR